MIFFTFSDFLNSIFLSSFTGIIFGCFYVASKSILISIKKFVVIFKDVYIAFKYKKRVMKDSYIHLSVVSSNIYEFILFSFFGLSTITVIYLTLDGVFRAYVVLIALLSFFISKNTVGTLFSKLYTYIFNKFYIVLFETLYIMLAPFLMLFNLIYSLIKKAILPLKIKKLRKISKKIIITKLKYINNLNSVY